ncbi:MAG TPA: ferritin [candidate division Zixibacteria bacterium]|nr:ferritin [candidate division Zixibacteria bacterium]
MMIPQKVADRLNEQVNHEYFNCWTYTAMAWTLEKMNLKAFAQWFFIQAKEEKGHAEKIANYLNDQGGTIRLKALGEPKSDYKSVEEIFQTALEFEKKTTKQVHEILALSRSENDPATENFIAWKVAEQVEEVSSVEYLLSIVKTVSSPKELFMLEGKVAKLVAKREG